VTTSARTTIPETRTTMRTVVAVTSTSPPPCAEGLISTEGAFSTAGDIVLPVLAVDQIGTQAASALEVAPVCLRLCARSVGAR